MINEFLQVIALLTGSAWVLYRLYKFRALKPKLQTEHILEIIHVEGHDLFLKVSVSIKNIGEVIVKDFMGEFTICNLSDLTEKDIKILDNKEHLDRLCLVNIRLKNFTYVPTVIEPNELDYAYKFLKLTGSSEIVEIHSLVQNVSFKRRGRIPFLEKLSSEKKEQSFGWSHSTIHKLIS